jgi:hypothetical protein
MALSFECINQDSLNIEEGTSDTHRYSKRVQQAAKALAEALDYDGLHDDAAKVWEFVNVD